MTDDHPLKMPLLPGDPMTDEQLAAFLDFDSVEEMFRASKSNGNDEAIETMLTIQTCAGYWMSSNQRGSLWHFYPDEDDE